MNHLSVEMKEEFLEKNEIELQEIKLLELNLLKAFHQICIKNSFRYSISGGTLLGAIRHKGFIPWDDDIDVFMPRSDYNRFVLYCTNNSIPFDLHCNEIEDGYLRGFAKLSDPNTRIVDNSVSTQNVKMGVWIDIFPVDGLGNDFTEAKKNYYKTAFIRELIVAKNWKKYERSITHGIIYEPIRLILFLISRFCSGKKLLKKVIKQYKKLDFDKCKYAGCIFGSYRTKEIMPREYFDEYELLTFENTEVYGVKKWDQFLRHLYGDYMQLPPVEKRETRHEFKAYYIKEKHNNSKKH